MLNGLTDDYLLILDLGLDGIFLFSFLFLFGWSMGQIMCEVGNVWGIYGTGQGSQRRKTVDWGGG